ncbi:Amylo-alpha-1,6-glucosidase [compost metagenome]
MIMNDLALRFGDKKEAIYYKDLAEKCKNSFNAKFYNENTKSLYDVLGDAKIRPNQIFALSLTYPVLDIDSYEAGQIINTIEEKLITPYGLKSLANGEIGYKDVYEGDGEKRDSSYHQGITWTWLLGPYYDSLKNIYINTKNKNTKKEYENKILEFRRNTYITFKDEIKKRGCIGSISEIYDSIEPYEPKGAIAQAWSVSEIFRIITGK